MDVAYEARVDAAHHPVSVHVRPATEERNRLTVAFRFFLALPHTILVGAPFATVSMFSWNSGRRGMDLGSGGGVVGGVVFVGAIIAWFAILLTKSHPDRLWRFGAWYLRWRVKSIAYLTLLRDEYPPFGDGPYPLELEVPRPAVPRDLLTVGFRILLAVPHLVVLWFLGVAWSFTTAIAWVVILVTGRYPETLYGFALGVLAWTTRVEAYVLLLTDEYPPFTLRT